MVGALGAGGERRERAYRTAARLRVRPTPTHCGGPGNAVYPDGAGLWVACRALPRIIPVGWRSGGLPGGAGNSRSGPGAGGRRFCDNGRRVGSVRDRWRHSRRSVCQVGRAAAITAAGKRGSTSGTPALLGGWAA
ncbi:hypothetical protein MPRM_38720 [Mycobacterium parmense]|uniref:Uncharacterized protein n=1 Tax=Mycobacterium parmense TaxID=185642 RepID=A0A7I7Z0R5_9MYCO|nr:hypothetical protein MPRM_38720 [Mycobacterium parmense]